MARLIEDNTSKLPAKVTLEMSGEEAAALVVLCAHQNSNSPAYIPGDAIERAVSYSTARDFYFIDPDGRVQREVG